MSCLKPPARAVLSYSGRRQTASTLLPSGHGRTPRNRCRGIPATAVAHPRPPRYQPRRRRRTRVRLAGQARRRRGEAPGSPRRVCWRPIQKSGWAAPRSRSPRLSSPRTPPPERTSGMGKKVFILPYSSRFGYGAARTVRLAHLWNALLPQKPVTARKPSRNLTRLCYVRCSR